MSIALYPVIGFLPLSQFISPVIFCFAALSFGVLLGIVHVPAIVHWNVAMFNSLVDLGHVTVNLILIAITVVTWIVGFGVYRGFLKCGFFQEG
jgi:hypothetical protein